MSNSSTMYIDIDDQLNIKSIQKKKKKSISNIENIDSTLSDSQTTPVEIELSQVCRPISLY
jgi:plasmid rolling circle replication initiator protein Rep